MTAHHDKSHAAAVEFAATHFEQYGLSHLQIGHPWTGVTLADALRAFTPSHVARNAMAVQGCEPIKSPANVLVYAEEAGKALGESVNKDEIEIRRAASVPSTTRRSAGDGMPLAQRIENVFSFIYAEKPGEKCYFDKALIDEIKAAALRGCTPSAIVPNRQQLTSFQRECAKAMCWRCREGVLPEYQADPTPTYWHEATECRASAIWLLDPANITTDGGKETI